MEIKVGDAIQQNALYAREGVGRLGHDPEAHVGKRGKVIQVVSDFGIIYLVNFENGQYSLWSWEVECVSE